jgi:hypothetical protein
MKRRSAKRAYSYGVSFQGQAKGPLRPSYVRAGKGARSVNGQSG